MLEGAKQEGTSDVAYSRNQPPVLEDGYPRLSNRKNSRIPMIPSMRLPPALLHGADDAAPPVSAAAQSTKDVKAVAWRVGHHDTLAMVTDGSDRPPRRERAVRDRAEVIIESAS